MIDTTRRIFAKTASWKLLGFITIMILSYAVTASLQEATLVAIAYHTMMFMLYFVHEKAWSRIKWGRTCGLFIQMTGLSGAGKTTIAKEVGERLKRRGLQVEIIDGDEYRKNLCSDLGFSRKDREENIKRLSFVGKVLTRNNVIGIMSAINPYNSTREYIKKDNKNSGLVYVKCDLEEVIRRDTKGLYKRAFLPDNDPDHIPNFTGISDVFEHPVQYDLHINTEKLTEAQATIKLEKFILNRITQQKEIKNGY
jgi:adenylylsulfate kinase